MINKKLKKVIEEELGEDIIEQYGFVTKDRDGERLKLTGFFTKNYRGNLQHYRYSGANVQVIPRNKICACGLQYDTEDGIWKTMGSDVPSLTHVKVEAFNDLMPDYKKHRRNAKNIISADEWGHDCKPKMKDKTISKTPPKIVGEVK